MLYVCVTDPATSRGRKKVAKEAEVFNHASLPETGAAGEKAHFLMFNSLRYAESHI